MKSYCLVLLFTGICYSLIGQVTNDPELLVRNKGSMFGYIQTFQPDPQLEGDYLYFKELRPVTLYLKDGNGTYRIEKANIDLYTQSFLVDIKDNLYSINYARIDSATFDGVSVTDYQYQTPNLSESVMAIILSRRGGNTLYKTIDIQVIKPNYNEALDTGNRNFVLRQKVKYYIDFGDAGILDLSKKLKAFKGQQNYEAIKKFVRQSGTDFESDKDMRRLNEYIATLN